MNLELPIFTFDHMVAVLAGQEQTGHVSSAFDHREDGAGFTRGFSSANPLDDGPSS